MEDLTEFLGNWWPTMTGVLVVGGMGYLVWPEGESTDTEAVVVSPPPDAKQVSSEQAGPPARPEPGEGFDAGRPGSESPQRPFESSSAERVGQNDAGRDVDSGRPPVGVQGPGVDRQEVLAALSRVPVELYETSWCPHCKRARAFLSANNLSFDAYDVEEDPAARRRKDQLVSGGGVPVVVIDGKAVSGYDEQAMKAYLQTAVRKRLDL